MRQADRAMKFLFLTVNAVNVQRKKYAPTHRSAEGVQCINRRFKHTTGVFYRLSPIKLTHLSFTNA